MCVREREKHTESGRESEVDTRRMVKSAAHFSAHSGTRDARALSVHTTCPPLWPQTSAVQATSGNGSNQKRAPTSSKSTAKANGIAHLHQLKVVCSLAVSWGRQNTQSTCLAGPLTDTTRDPTLHEDGDSLRKLWNAVTWDRCTDLRVSGE